MREDERATAIFARRDVLAARLADVALCGVRVAAAALLVDLLAARFAVVFAVVLVADRCLAVAFFAVALFTVALFTDAFFAAVFLDVELR